MHNLEQRIDELESKLAFQEHTVDELNAVICRQDEELRQVKQQLIEFYQQFKSLNAQLNPEISDSKPPHY